MAIDATKDIQRRMSGAEEQTQAEAVRVAELIVTIVGHV